MISKKILSFQEAHLQFQFFLRYFESLVIQSDRNLLFKNYPFQNFFRFAGLTLCLPVRFPLNHPVIVKPSFRPA
jgi:hypothetical protein